LRLWWRTFNSPQKHVWRAKIVLLTADGRGTAEIMRATGKAKTVIWRWQERFRDEGAAGLWRDKTRPSRIPPLDPEVVNRVVALTLAGPPLTVSHWTGSAMATAVGISVSSVQRIWRAHGLEPHGVRRFKLSNDPQFAAKLREIVGLYADPPDHAIVMSVDEKSRCHGVARETSALRLPLHPHIRFLAQRRRGLLRQTHNEASQTWCVPISARTQKRHPPLPRRRQRKPQALYLDQGPEQNHRRGQTRAPSVRFDSLDIFSGSRG
jgi:transposase